MRKLFLLIVILPFYNLSIISAQEFQQGVNYKINAELTPSDFYLRFSSETTYKNNSQDTLHEVYFRLYWNIFKQNSYARKFNDEADVVTNGVEIKKLLINNKNARYNIDNTILKIPLEDYLLPGDSVIVKIDADELVPASELRMGRVFRDYCIGQWIPAVCVYDKYGWQIDQYMGVGEFNEEIGNFDVSLTLPASYLVFYTGKLENPREVLPEEAYKKFANLKDTGFRTRIYNQYEYYTQINDSIKKTWKFKAEQVRTFAFAASENRIWDACKQNGVIINTVYNPAGEAYYINNGMDAAKKAVDYFSSVFGPYPYPNVFVFEAENIGGGMEYPGLTFVLEANSSMMEYVNANVIIHEIGHNWCPMMINSNETRNAFLDEGMTDYFTECAMNEFIPGDNMIKLSGIIKDIIPSQSVSEYSYSRVIQNDKEDITEPLVTHSDRYHSKDNYGINAYPRSVKTYRMLRYLMGEQAFSELFHEYYARYKFRHVYPEDFFNLVQEINARYNTKKDLYWFFDEWFYKTYKLDYAFKSMDYQLSNGKYLTSVTVENCADAVMPADVEIKMENGEKANLHFEAEQFFNNGRYVTNTIELFSKPVKAVVDPDIWLLDQNRLNNTSSFIPPIFFHFNPFISLIQQPKIDKYSLYWFPAIGFNNVDGFKLGLNLQGSYMGIEKKLDLTIMQGMKFGKNSFGADFSIGDRISFIGRRAYGFISCFNYEGRRGGSVRLTNRWNDYSYYPSFTLTLTGNYFDAYDDNYFDKLKYDMTSAEYPDIPIELRKYYWVSTEMEMVVDNNWLRNSINLGIEAGSVRRDNVNIAYQKITFTGKQNIWLNGKKLINLRQFIGYSPVVLPIAKKYNMAVVNPVDEFSSYIYRTEGIISHSARQKRSVPWGEGYMRGYYNQNMPGDNISTVNAEIQISSAFSPVPVLGPIIGILSPVFFVDAGRTWNDPDEFRFNRLLTDYGFSVKLPLIIRFYGTNVLSSLEKMGINSISFDFPVYVSSPLPGEDKIAFRWLFSFQAPL